MPSEIDLLQSLDDEPRTPSTVDVRRAITDGRRRRRIRRGVGYASAAAVTVLAVAGASLAGGRMNQAPSHTAATTARPKAPYKIPGTAGWRAPAASPPTSCTLNRLPVPDNEPQALVSGADPAGRYIVGRTYPKRGSYQAVIWHDGKVRKANLPGNEEESLRDVNSKGTAVGWSYAGKPVPYVYRDGKVSKLPGVKNGSANAINDAGAILGDDDSGKAILVWPSATAKPFRLPLPAGTSGAEAGDIDEDGTVVGTLNDKQPYVWFPDGTHRELAMPSLDGSPVTEAHVFTIHNGWATGVATKDLNGNGTAGAGGGIGSVRWNVRTGETQVFDQFLVRASTANAHGWQVGTDHQGRAVFMAGTATVTLPDLYAHQKDDLQNIATTVSDDGRTIAGQSDDATTAIQAVVWRCQ